MYRKWKKDNYKNRSENQRDVLEIKNCCKIKRHISKTKKTSRIGVEVQMIEKQIKDLAWNTFKQTGDINTFLEFIQIENMGNNQIQNQLENVKGNKMQN